jgi:hypothetical protein
MDYWEPTMGALEAIVDCLDVRTQQKIVERLQLLAQVQADRGLVEASYFSRCLSGEPYPGEESEQPKTKHGIFTVIKGGRGDAA